jgi:hypothetical protein
MNDAQLLERLTSAYATVEAPTPSTALAELMDAGGAVADDDETGGVVVPFASPRPRARVRYLVAALVASFVALSGLAVAGALPDSIQRQVSSVVSHLGIDLPNPQPVRVDVPGPSNIPTAPGPRRAPSSSTSTPSPTKGAGGTVGAPAAGQQPVTAPATTAPAGSLGDIGDVGGLAGGTTPTTLPGNTIPTLPPISIPPITLPPISVPGLPLPPITLPPIQIDLPLLHLGL